MGTSAQVNAFDALESFLGMYDTGQNIPLPITTSFTDQYSPWELSLYIYFANKKIIQMTRLPNGELVCTKLTPRTRRTSGGYYYGDY